MIEQNLTNALDLNDCVKFDGCNEFDISGHTGLMIERGHVDNALV